MEISKFGRIVGWIGCAVLVIGLIPSAWKAWSTHSAVAIGWLFLISWLIGMVCLLCYIVETNIKNSYYQWPLWIACLVNIILTCYIVFVKIMY